MIRKWHIKTDTQGFLVGPVVHAADTQDRDGAAYVLSAIRHRFPWLRLVFADGGYAGRKLKAALAKIDTWTVQIVKHTDKAKRLRCHSPALGCRADLRLAQS